jgi:membrane-associated protease RseP (regulator of RpoE activity)
MDGGDETGPPPAAEEIAPVFDVYEMRRNGEEVIYVGEPAVAGTRTEEELWELFRTRGYEISLKRGHRSEGEVPISPGEYVLVAEPWSNEIDGIPRTNLLLFVATICSTFLAGAVFWYDVAITQEPLRILEAWPFVAAIIGVLGIHELGHYVMSRYHGVKASLPYFIPVPTVIGSMGAVIKMEGKIPDRKALFDIGAAGPLAGLAATVVVTAIGLQLDPLPAQQAAASQAEAGEQMMRFNHPPLLELIAMATGTTGQLENGVVHPVVFGGWVGMLVTVLNMLPVGQLDGGHILRAMVGEQQERIASFVPLALFGLAGYLLVIADGIDSVGIWMLWGLFAIGLAYAGPADPLNEGKLGRKRMLVGIVTFALAALCFTPVPVEIVQAA